MQKGLHVVKSKNKQKKSVLWWNLLVITKWRQREVFFNFKIGLCCPLHYIARENENVTASFQIERYRLDFFLGTKR